jgi:nuclear pore complex protein Nup98-Nup96
VTSTNNNDDVVTTTTISPPHPANIVLDRPGYFTIPSMHDLAAMTDMKTGDCFVENFAIGRVDYGCITFTGMTNVSNINLDECVFIRRKEVHVYPDDTRKPPVGEGLNKQAEITLHRIWPTDKQTKQPITDTQRILKMGYYKKIEKATLEMDAQFVDYDPITGSWTFRVKHFSKYGLNDDDDDDDEDNQDSENGQDNNEENFNGNHQLMNRLSR